MILNLFRKNRYSDAVNSVYNSIVAQSRLPRFYAEWGVPDTPTGRFDMISLHLGLLFRRLGSEGDEARAFSQELYDAFFKDMDRSLREMGVGDLGVPKRIHKMTSAFHGLMEALAGPLAAGDAAAIERVLVRNLYDGIEEKGAGQLAAYLVDKAESLDGWPADEVLSGRLDTEVAA